jgi:hypothetical protein
VDDRLDLPPNWKVNHARRKATRHAEGDQVGTDEDVDLAVIGSGGAAMAAAISAQ